MKTQFADFEEQASKPKNRKKRARMSKRKRRTIVLKQEKDRLMGHLPTTTHWERQRIGHTLRTETYE